MIKRYILIGFVGCFLLGVAGCQIGPARTVRELDFDWKFIKRDIPDAQAKTFNDAQWRTVQLPHDWSIEEAYSEDYASSTGYLPGGIGWYRKTFALKHSLRDKRISVEFDGIYNNSEVWINGIYLGRRPYGYISFQYDLTPYVNFGGENILAVRVDHSQFADSRWYTGSGIYRHVRLLITNPLHIAHWGTFVTTPIAAKGVGQVQVETTVDNTNDNPKAYTLQWRLLDERGNEVGSAQTKATIRGNTSQTLTRTMAVLNPRLWSPDSPNMYTLQSRIVEGLQVVDKTTTPFGIRQFKFDPDKGFFLNGKNMKIKGVCLHHDGGPVGAAVPEKVWVQRFKKLKEIGCNAIRCSHNPPAPEFLDLCDRMGFLVMDEAFDEFTPPKKKWIKGRNNGIPSYDGYGTVFREWSIPDIQDMIRRDRNHPSIILWSIGNEIDYPNDPFSHSSMGENYQPDQPPAENLTLCGKPLVDAVKQMDSSRPTTAALANAPVSNRVGFADILDVVGYNYQEQLYRQDHRRYPNRPLIGSENSTSLNAWEAVSDNEYISGQFLWIGIDYLGESPGWPIRSWTGGLFDLCGFKKPLGWFRQSLWADKPMVYLACRSPEEEDSPRRRRRRRPVVSHWNWQEGQEIQTLCYTNCDEVELFLNGISLGNQSYDQARRRTLSWDIPFRAGTLTAVGKCNGKAVCEYHLQTADKAQKIKLVPDTARLAADGKDVCYLEFDVTDQDGVRVFNAEHEITFTVTGPAELIALGNGNPADHQSHVANNHRVWQGRGLAIVRTKRKTGIVTVRAESEGLDPAVVTLTAE